MKILLRSLLVIVGLWFCIPTQANAATCFWVGGTGTWDNSADAAHWSSGTGGSGSTCAATGGVPKNAGDVATFDASSGGGTVTNNVDLAIGQITMGAFTGTLDFATNNKNVTLTVAFSNSGTGTRTLNMGNGTWTLSSGSGSLWDFTTTTNLTFNANSSVLNFTSVTGAARSFVSGGKTYATVGFTSASQSDFAYTITGGPTIATLNATGPLTLAITGATTVTVTNMNINGGSSTSAVILQHSAAGGTVGTISASSGTIGGNWVVLTGITCSGGATFAFTNSIDFARNTTCGITAPAGGATGHIIGGYLLNRDLHHDNDNLPAFLDAVAA